MMKIIRDGKALTLSKEELEQAYREQEGNYRLDDAKAALLEFLDVEDASEIPQQERLCFKESFGIDIDAALDVNSNECILKAILAEYEDEFDCNISENEQFDNAVRKALDYLENRDFGDKDEQ